MAISTIVTRLLNLNVRFFPLPINHLAVEGLDIVRHPAEQLLYSILFQVLLPVSSPPLRTPPKLNMEHLPRIELPPTADMHVHLRQGDMMDLVVPTLRQGGVDTAFV